MKKPLLLLIMITSLYCFPQGSYNRAYHNANEKANPFLVNINADLYFTTQEHGLFNGGSCQLYKHNSSGVLQYKSTAVAGTPSFGFKTLDNKLLVSGIYINCGYNPNYTPFFITKLDPIGTAVFTATYAVPYVDNLKAVLQHSDSSFFSFTDSLMFVHDKTGQFMSENNLGLKDISSAILLPSNNILLSATLGGVSSLVEINPSGTILSIKTLPILLNKMAFYGGQKIVGLGADGKVYKISGNHQLIASSNFPGTLTVSNFAVRQDSIYCLAVSSGVLSQYFIADTTFAVFNLSSTVTDRIYQQAIVVDAGRVSVLSTGKSNPGSLDHSFASLNTFNKANSNNFTNDIALLSVEADSSYTACQIYPPTSGYVCHTYLRAKIKVKNKGTNTISNFKLNCFETPGEHCGGEYYQEKFNNLALQPGDSITLTGTAFVAKYPLGPVQNTNFNMNHCFYTTLPNDETDKTLADNEICKNMNFTITGIQKQNNIDSETSIYPNPFENSVQVQSAFEIKKIELLNALGSRVKTIEVKGSGTIVSTQELPAGIYFLQVETEKGNMTKKIVKQ